MNRPIMLASVLLAVLSAQPLLAQPSPQSGRVMKLDEMRWPDIDALNRDRTMVLLPVGMIEEHGPHLPVGADGIGITYETAQAAERVARALPEWQVVLMPPVNYGTAGADLISGRLSHPGTYSIRQATLRAIIADLGAQLARNGFKRLFVLSGHAAPTHSLVIDEACDFVSETFNVSMLHLTSLFRADAEIQAAKAKIDARHFSPAQLAGFGVDVHAGVSETSQMLFVHPELVGRDYKALPPQSAMTTGELRDVATRPGWKGYFSDPARATAEYGADVKTWWIEGFTSLIVRAVRGENMVAHPRAPESVPPPMVPVLDKVLSAEAAFGAGLDSWLLRRRKR